MCFTVTVEIDSALFSEVPDIPIQEPGIISGHPCYLEMRQTDRKVLLRGR